MFDLANSQAAHPSGPPQGQAANPLYALMQIARANAAIARTSLPTASDGLPWAPWMGAFESEAPPQESHPARYDSIELAGEAGLYGHIEADPDLEILYTGACAWEVRGIDAIARRRSTGRYLICEAKGSERALSGSPLAYLHHTRHKGRQLTWEWCWKSVVDMADFPTTAQAFLELLGPMLNGEVERLLVVSRVAWVDGELAGGYGVVERCVFLEAELNGCPPLAVDYELSRQRGMFEVF